MSLDLRDRPAYPLAEVARYALIPAATVRFWTLPAKRSSGSGRRAQKPLIRIADPANTLFSFNNLIELHVLGALRSHHGTRVTEIRKAITYAESELGIDRLLLRCELLTDGRHLFVEQLTTLLNLSRSGEIAIKSLLEAYLERVERDDLALPMRLFPFVRTATTQIARDIAIDPNIAFGRPIVASRSISTQVIAERIDAGESREEVAADYGLKPDEVTAAVVYERAA